MYDSAALTGNNVRRYSAANLQSTGIEQLFRQAVDDATNSYDRNISGDLNSNGVKNSDGRNGYTDDKVINTVLNINDSHTVALLSNFNVSKDEILRRISASQPLNDSATFNDQPSHSENEANASTSNEDIEKRE